MRLSIVTISTALLLCSSAARAQTNAPAANNATTPPAANTTTTNPAGPGQLRDHIRTMLQQSGFSDIRMMPSSFMIRAKDGSGNPVVMSISPDSLTEVAETGTSGSNTSDQGTSGATNRSQGGPEFATVGQNDDLSSNLVGLDVYSGSNQNIGQIKDIAMDPQGRAKAYIVSVGGFLGMDQRYVAVNPNDIKVSYNTSDQKWHASMKTTAAELKSAPQFQYNGRWNASKS
jgi:sporulation protein YlmC with PRC-barrel domain